MEAQPGQGLSSTANKRHSHNSGPSPLACSFLRQVFEHLFRQALF